MDIRYPSVAERDTGIDNGGGTCEQGGEGEGERERKRSHTDSIDSN